MRRRALIAVALTGLAVSCGKLFRGADNSIHFVEVPAGTYQLGSVEGGPLEQPRRVTTAGFLISADELTERQAGLGESKCPIAGVTLEEARSICTKLSRDRGEKVRLPTEDEWEIAARGGVRSARFPWGWGDPEGRSVFAAKSAQKTRRFPANGYGIYDAAGNIAEFCESSLSSSQAVVRGGSWADRDPNCLRVFSRTIIDSRYSGSDVGFRVVAESATR